MNNVAKTLNYLLETNLPSKMCDNYPCSPLLQAPLLSHVPKAR